MYDFPHTDADSCGFLYADDSLLYAHDESLIGAMSKVKHYLEEVNRFYNIWDF